MDKMLTSKIQLNWLRTFETVGNCLSFTRAAEELHMSQSAVSQQMQLLEHHLGQQLFIRVKRSVLLSDAGKAFLPLVEESLKQLNVGAAKIFSPRESATVDVSVNSAFGILWLAPRMQKFNGIYPQISIRQLGTNWSSDFDISTAELEIRYGTGSWSGFTAERLVTPVLRPYCGVENTRWLRKPEDILSMTLLDVIGTPKGWEAWCEHYGLDIQQARSLQYMDSHGTAVTMAANGLGMCLMYDELMQTGVLASQLTAPFSESITTEGSYYLCYKSNTTLSQGARYFVDWLLEEVNPPGRYQY